MPTVEAKPQLPPLATLEWTPYSFYHDRLAPFDYDEADPVHVIGLFRDGTYMPIYPIVDDQGRIIIGSPYNDSHYCQNCHITKPTLLPDPKPHFLIDVINPFDIVAVAQVRLSPSGDQLLDINVRRSYVLIEHPVFDPIHPNERLPLFGEFDPALDHGEFFLRQHDVNRLLHSDADGRRGEAFCLENGKLAFLENDILADDLDGIDCFAAHGIIGESDRHIFVGIAKRAPFIEAARREAIEDMEAKNRSAERRAQKSRRKEAEKKVFTSGCQFDSTESNLEFDARNKDGRLQRFRPEFDAYLTNIAQVRFTPALVSLLAREEDLAMDTAVQIIQAEFTQYAIKKVITYAATVEKEIVSGQF